MTAAEEPSADLAADPRGHSPADRAAPSSSGSEVSSDGGGDDETADLEEDALLEEDMDEDLDQYRCLLASPAWCILFLCIIHRSKCCC